MNPNPSVILVSLVTRAIVSRTTFAEWAIANDSLGLGYLGELANKLRDTGIAEVNDHLLISVEPTDAEVLAFLKHASAANSDILPVGESLASVIATASGDGYARFIVAPRRELAGSESATTLREAFAKVRANMLSPKDRAEKKRAEAANLLAEADKLFPVAPDAVQPGTQREPVATAA